MSTLATPTSFKKQRGNCKPCARHSTDPRQSSASSSFNERRRGLCQVWSRAPINRPSHRSANYSRASIRNKWRPPPEVFDACRADDSSPSFDGMKGSSEGVASIRKDQGKNRPGARVSMKYSLNASSSRAVPPRASSNFLRARQNASAPSPDDSHRNHGTIWKTDRAPNHSKGFQWLADAPLLRC